MRVLLVLNSLLGFSRVLHRALSFSGLGYRLWGDVCCGVTVYVNPVN